MIETIDVLSALQAALETEQPEANTIFREQVMTPLKPFFQFPGGGAGTIQDDQDEPELALARAFGLYTPELNRAEGLAAIALLKDHKSVEAGHRALERAMTALAPEQHGVTLEPIRYTLLLMNPAVLREDYGSYSGFQRSGIVAVSCFPNSYNLPRLPAAAAHELNHIVRLTVEPWTDETTVGQYIVLEGLAERFAVELLGESILGPYATALSADALEAVKPRFAQALEQTGDIRGYIFGDWAAAQFHYPKQGLPDFPGYTVGYQIVDAYLRRSGRTAAEASYVPWRDIVTESGFFADW